MPTCRRCGTSFVRLTLAQTRCERCQREVDALVAPKPEPAFVPAWRRRDLKRDETGLYR